ncbi:hypothetical protein OI18_18250 [Flavihumibacter solisilvae]|uniref:Uncharacterized protein n=1 Tax=Flavihumibacter solisilvae TaxID=1349421 RepID=A0A0C1IRZ0_9BACT|nr:hypothetical protein OI18_18250 [Flavihumibacter solisilvae]
MPYLPQEQCIKFFLIHISPWQFLVSRGLYGKQSLRPSISMEGLFFLVIDFRSVVVVRLRATVKGLERGCKGGAKGLPVFILREITELCKA